MRSKSAPNVNEKRSIMDSPYKHQGIGLTKFPHLSQSNYLYLYIHVVVFELINTNKLLLLALFTQV